MTQQTTCKTFSAAAIRFHVNRALAYRVQAHMARRQGYLGLAHARFVQAKTALMQARLAKLGGAKYA
ncbi:MAG: hypothetical protein MN733_03420 [Nitrososphaera sp.]|nr:hypothetical protein [Nitrososphaera sp.]